MTNQTTQIIVLIKYDVDYQEAEDYFFTFAERENLGSTEITLPEMKDFHTPLSIEAEGPRAGFPVNSHCDQDHKGIIKWLITLIK